VLGVEIRETKELIGHVGLSTIPEGAEIGYAIAIAHQGKGYGTEAVTVFSVWSAQNFELPCIWAILMADNEPSRRVLEKAGYAPAWQGERNAFGGIHLCLGYLYSREEKS
jgi:RimJ/RimL family protein N-acetyltransferase